MRPARSGSAAGRSPAFSGATGLGRLFSLDMGGQIGWLLPAALLALAALAWMSRRAPRTDRTRAAVLLWGGWLLLTGLVFSFMAGIIHPYYTVALAPPIGALVGIGATRLWRARGGWAARGTLAAVVTVHGALVSCAARPHPGLAPAVACGDHGRRAHRGRGPAGRPALARLARTARGRTALAVAPVSLALLAAFAGPGSLQPRHRRRRAHRGDPVRPARPWPRRAVQAGPAAPGQSAGRRRRSAWEQVAPAAAAARRAPVTGGSAAGRSQSGPGGGLGGATQVQRGADHAAQAKRVRIPVGRRHGRHRRARRRSSWRPGSRSCRWADSTAPTRPRAWPSSSGWSAEHEIHYFVGANAHSFGGGSGAAAEITTWVRTHFRSQTVGGMTVYDLTRPLAGT